MSAFTQKERFLLVETPLGPDVLLLRSFSGHETMSQLFEFHLDMLSTEPDLDPKEIVGKSVTVRMQIDVGQERYFNGFVSRFRQVGAEGRYAVYDATVVPWFWFLTRTTDCRIFQNKSVPTIVEDIFKENGLRDYEISLQGSYKEREYCVQYRETDFNFVSRLFEEEGIFYFFRHQSGKHTLVIADGASVHSPCPLISEAPYAPDIDVSPGMQIGDVMTSWASGMHFTSGKLAQQDYNFETPSTDLLAKTNSVVSVSGNTSYELYDYPGEYANRGDGSDLAKIRMEEVETGHIIYTATGNCRSLASGYHFDLTDHFNSGQNATYLLVSVHHQAFEKTYQTADFDMPAYTNRVTAIAKDVPFRPERITPRPFVHGVQTAVVVGPSGEEIYPDEYGRVKVHFFWDRYSNRDEHSSCWIRVSQGWAGKTWGFVHTPRIGQEVIVDFLEGDPDRPIITGRVYNDEQMPPYKLPDHKTRSGMKSRSSKNGDDKNFNEFRFEDLKGEELVYLHAEKDFDTFVEKVSREYVGIDKHLIVEKIVREHIKKDVHTTIDGKRQEAVGGDNTRTVGSNELVNVGQNLGLDVGMGLREKIGMNWSAEAGQSVFIKGGMNVVVEAGLSLTLKVGGNFVNISPAGVAISGTMVLINSGGMAGVGIPVQTPQPQTPELPEDEGGEANDGDDSGY